VTAKEAALGNQELLVRNLENPEEVDRETGPATAEVVRML
jgi:hypothetical protein